jgi:plastocyanin
MNETTRRTVGWTVAIVVIVVVLAAIGIYSSMSPAAVVPVVGTGSLGPSETVTVGGGNLGPAEGNLVTIEGNQYNPDDLMVDVGETVKWINMDSVTHTVTSVSGSELDSQEIPAGGVWEHTFSTPGTFEYACTIHPGMMGKVTVNGPAEVNTPPTVTIEDTPAADSGTPADSAMSAYDGSMSPPTVADGPSDSASMTSPTVINEYADAVRGTAVTITDNGFEPMVLMVEPGQTVTWTNMAATSQTVTSDSGSKLDSGRIPPGGTYAVIVSSDRTQEYHSNYNWKLKGVLLVGPQ